MFFIIAKRVMRIENIQRRMQRQRENVAWHCALRPNALGV